MLQTVRCFKAPPERKDFPRPGQILPAPGRNVTAGDKERNRCRVATKGGIWHRAAMTERVRFAGISPILSIDNRAKLAYITIVNTN